MSQDSINELLESLKAEFLATLPERLGEIENLVLDLTEQDDVGSLLRVVHSLKGAAGTHGHHMLTRICHQMEGMMRELVECNKIHSQKAVDLLLGYNDLMDETLELLNNEETNLAGIEQKLNQFSSTLSTRHYKVLIAEPSALYCSMPMHADLFEHIVDRASIRDGSLLKAVK